MSLNNTGSIRKGKPINVIKNKHNLWQQVSFGKNNLVQTEKKYALKKIKTSPKINTIRENNRQGMY